jgi:membrane protein
MRKPALTLRFAFDLLKEAVREWSQHDAMRLSAALAYYSIFSLAPLLLICLAAAGWAFGPDAARGYLEDQLRGVLGSKVAESVQTLVKDAAKPSSSLTAAIIGTLTLLVGAAGVFGQLKDSLNRIWDVRPKPGRNMKRWLLARAMSFLMVLIMGLLLLASVVATTALSALTGSIERYVPFSEGATAGMGAAVSFVMITLLFAAIFKILPDAEVQWRHVWIGAVFTALLFEAGKFGLGFYLGRESTTSAYGAAASAVLILLWVYYASMILFFGAAFTKAYAGVCQEKVPPTPDAEPAARRSD